MGESGSIQTQRELLTKYCDQNHFPIADYYCDDGYSGTNFDRPEFQRMLRDIESGKVNLVVVKDLSRFGREYAQMGLYIEHYFEEQDVRFISVMESIDTINGSDNILMPITNVINSLYAKDCSKKTKAAHRTRASAGKYMGGHAPFGYSKDPEDKHHLLVDPPAAMVVGEIFRMFGDGIGYVRMTKILRERKILNPQAYFNQNNPDYYKSDYWRKPFDWHATSIRTILNNPVYLGKVVFGRTRTKGFYQKKREHVPQDEWIVVEDTHEPIITQEAWDLAHKLMASRRRETRRGEVQMFAGLVRCADCGSALNLSYDAKKGKYKNFSCWVYKNYGKSRCTSHAIGWQTLCALVLEDIRQNAGIAELAADNYIRMLAELREAKKQDELRRYRRELKQTEKRLTELDKILKKLYEDYALEKLENDRYQAMSGEYEEERMEQAERHRLAVERIQNSEAIYQDVENFTHLIRKYTDIQELNARILNELIDKIVVHEKELLPDGGKAQQVDIYYKFVGCVVLDLPECVDDLSECAG